MAREGLRRWPDGDWGWSFRLLCAEALMPLARVPEARKILQWPGKPAGAGLQARWMVDRARVAPQTADRSGLMHEALQAALAAHDRALACTIRLRLGDLAATGGEAEAYDRAALADAQVERDPYLLAWAWLDIGYRKARLSRFDEAIPFFDRSIANAQQCGAKSFLGIALGNLGWAYLMLGDLDRAREALTRAETLCERIGLRDYQHRWLGELGNICMIRGDLDRAANYQQRAATVARDIGNDYWLAIAYTNLAEISIDRSDLAAARSYNDRSLAIKRRLNDPWTLLYSEANTAEIDLAARQYDEARKAYQIVIDHAPAAHAPSILWYADARLGEVYRKTGKPALADTQYRKAIATIDSEWNKLTADDWKTTFLAPQTLIGFFQDYVEFLIDRGQSQRALEVAESSRARVLNQRLEHRDAVSPNFDLGQLLSAARAAHTVILSYWLAPARSFLSGHWRRLPFPLRFAARERDRRAGRKTYTERDPRRRSSGAERRRRDRLIQYPAGTGARSDSGWIGRDRRARWRAAPAQL